MKVVVNVSPIRVVAVRGTTAVGGGGGVTDHGALNGLGDDDHPHYLTAPRPAAEEDGRILKTVGGALAYADDSQSEAGELVFFLEDEADPAIAGYKVMDNPAQLEAVAYVTEASVADAAIVQEWITDVGLPGATFIPSGAWQFHINAYKTGGTKATRLYNEVYKRALDGTETLLGTTGNSILLTDSEATLPAFNVYIEGLTLLATDRIVTKTRIRLVGGGSNPTSVTVGYSGSTAARLTIPSQAVDVTQLATKTELAALIPAYTAEAALTSSAAISWDVTAIRNATLALNHNATLTLSGMTAGQTVTLSGTMAAGGLTLGIAHSGLTLRMMDGSDLATIATLFADDLFELTLKRTGNELRGVLNTKSI